MPRPREPIASAADPFRLDHFMPDRIALIAMRLNQAFVRHHIDRFGISLSEWRVLAMIGRFETSSPSVVADQASMDKVSVSRATATLVARGLLRQGPDPSDGRGRLLRLTRKGQAIHAALVPAARAFEAELAGCMSRQDWAALTRALSRISTFLGTNTPAALDQAGE